MRNEGFISSYKNRPQRARLFWWTHHYDSYFKINHKGSMYMQIKILRKVKLNLCFLRILHYRINLLFSILCKIHEHLQRGYFFLGDFLTGGFPVVDLSQYLENSDRFICSFFYKPNQWSENGVFQKQLQHWLVIWFENVWRV